MMWKDIVEKEKKKVNTEKKYGKGGREIIKESEVDRQMDTNKVKYFNPNRHLLYSHSILDAYTSFIIVLSGLQLWENSILN